MTIREQLFELQEEKYADFQSKLTPNLSREAFIGVRVPILRKLAKQLIKEEKTKNFYSQMPHQYYDENMLHALLISEMKDFEQCIRALEAFLPYVDNWAVCDILSPKIFKKHKTEIIEKIREWTTFSHDYTIRFGIEMLMSFYLDDDFDLEYLEIPANVQNEEYYVRMMVAWFFATALAKQWDATISYLENHRLESWVHNKTIQKARESNRITSEQKEYLNTLKVRTK